MLPPREKVSELNQLRTITAGQEHSFVNLMLTLDQFFLPNPAQDLRVMASGMLLAGVTWFDRQ